MEITIPQLPKFEGYPSILFFSVPLTRYLFWVKNIGNAQIRRIITPQLRSGLLSKTILIFKIRICCPIPYSTPEMHTSPPRFLALSLSTQLVKVCGGAQGKFVIGHEKKIRKTFFTICSPPCR